MSKNMSGVIKRILKDILMALEDALHSFPPTYRPDIEETVLKEIRCGTSDLG